MPKPPLSKTAGSKGGETTKRRHGLEYYRHIGRMGNAARRRRLEAAKLLEERAPDA